jgi:TetR/AcrR family transcriptional regulator
MHGFRGATIDRIAEHAGMSKPNLLYYFRRKQDIYESLIARLLVKWLEPLQELDAVGGDPCRNCNPTFAASSRWRGISRAKAGFFANEILQGAPRIKRLLESELKPLVDEKARCSRAG